VRLQKEISQCRIHVFFSFNMFKDVQTLPGYWLRLDSDTEVAVLGLIDYFFCVVIIDKVIDPNPMEL